MTNQIVQLHHILVIVYFLTSWNIFHCIFIKLKKIIFTVISKIFFSEHKIIYLSFKMATNKKIKIIKPEIKILKKIVNKK